jgi:outer membrane biosynthesis protein TonB
MTKMLSLVIAGALVAALLVGVALTSLGVQSHAADSQGLMPEVVVTAEMPRLVMPTVEVQAFRSVAMSASRLNVN